MSKVALKFVLAKFSTGRLISSVWQKSLKLAQGQMQDVLKLWCSKLKLHSAKLVCFNKMISHLIPWSSFRNFALLKIKNFRTLFIKDSKARVTRNINGDSDGNFDDDYHENYLNTCKHPNRLTIKIKSKRIKCVGFNSIKIWQGWNSWNLVIFIKKK